MLPIPQTPVSDLPTADRWLCKPKSHSYRCFAFRDGKTVDIRSKRGTLLNRHFPYVVAALAKVNAQTFVLDGELLVISDGRRDFDSEQLRMHPGESRAKKLSAEAPALFMAFDLVVAAKGKDVSREPFEVRREVLEVRGAGKSPMIPAVRDHTVDRHGARLVEAGRSVIDGIVAKRGAERDPAGKRMMQKFKR